MKNLPTPAAIEAEFGRLNRLRFAPEVESRFDLDGLAERKRVGRMTLLFGILIYNVFLFADWQVVPDMVGWLALLRLGVFTPIGLALYVWFASCASKTWHLDAASVGGTLLALVLPTAAAVFSQSPYVVIYQFGSMITITYFTLVQRVQFRFALVALTLSLAIQLGCVALRPEIDAASYLFIVNFYLAGAALLLVGSYTLERTERREFLERMRVEFLAGRIEQVARTDRLTGLWNRHHLAEVAPELAAGNPAAPIGALMIDIDHFKRFNDTQGHIAGDGCIRDVAGIVRATIEEAGGAPCHAFRFGGEEFLLLLPGRDLLQGAALGEAIRRRLRAKAIPHPAMGEEALVTVSVGVAVCRAGSFSLDALVGAADAALYQAKRGGRDRLVMAA